ncbi:hypothetical protein [Nocardia sp. CY41]|uniref:hypothetical protein n=1 Tax=Nocardia sp. CY41 TaxID=2608686 RepID=UPI001357924C|nr:hypothetical protein [Nocardia sp. CY41]
MTVITETLTDLAGTPHTDEVFFSSYILRENDDGDAMITTSVRSYTPVNGVITTEDLDPGPARVRIGMDTYNITIPESATPVRLWPLIETGLPAPPTLVGAYVVNGGGIARVQKLTESEYAALTLPDPETEYSVVPDPE